MRKIFLLFFSFFSTLLFAYVDSDFDGVDDADDRCPNTPFMELVDINGCSTKSLVSAHHFDLIVGVNYSESNYQTLSKTETLSNNIQFDYYYKNFSLQATTTYFSTKGSGYNESGLYDSFFGASYQFEPSSALSLRVGVGGILPTYKTALNNNKTDYLASLNASYLFGNFSLFGGYSYTLINDEDTTIVYATNTVQKITYKNTNAWNMGIGYYWSNALYINTSFNSSESLYKNSQDIKTASLYLYYTLSEHWFTTLSYARGLSDTASKNYASVRLGYFF